MFELQGYLDRIELDPRGLSGRELLFAAHRNHTMHIPFECLSPFLGEPVLLDEDSLYDKMVTRRRGGYCFEQNGLFALAAEALGFSVRPSLVRLWKADGFGPYLHRNNRVTAEGKEYLCDVGFGDCFDEPLLMEYGTAQKRMLGTYRIVPDERVGHCVQVLNGEVWENVMGFSDYPTVPRDFEVGNYYCSTCPTSVFRGSIMVSRYTREGRVSIANRKLTITKPDGSKTRMDLPADIGPALKEWFGIEMPEVIAPEE